MVDNSFCLSSNQCRNLRFNRFDSTVQYSNGRRNLCDGVVWDAYRNHLNHEFTTTAPLTTPTFTLVGGGGSVNGDPIKGIDQQGTIMLFNPERGTQRIRTFILDPQTGRLRDRDTGVSVCAYYDFAESPSDPVHFGFCQNGNTGPGMYYDYLTCEIVNGKLACTAPKASCSGDGFEDISCVSDPTSGLNNQFYYKYDARNGDYLYISSGSPSSYTPVDIIVQEA
ncbi:hypothetical protein QX201_004098 [Fusarium graminearum]